MINDLRFELSFNDISQLENKLNFCKFNKIKNFIVMRFILFLFLGFFVGLYLSWPGLVIPENWKCFNEIIAKSTEDKISLRAAMEITASYVLKRKNRKTVSKIRIVADACFR